ncbi:RHS repeat-associated core domain-containing protein [Microbulbifer sp. VTAC004]|uniref:RHS repeat-associated core domain-containing protein n=1 Tax=Microbulbifer sp. VTAC004 TaxID=3243386 RepID=UPI0040394D60
MRPAPSLILHNHAFQQFADNQLFLVRFVSADPLIDGITSVQGYNRYAYVHNNPLTYTDPSGYSSWNKFRDAFVNGRDVMRYLGSKPLLNAVAQIALCVSMGPSCPGALAAYSAAQTYHVTGEIGRAFANGVLAAASAAAFSGMPGAGVRPILPFAV